MWRECLFSQSHQGTDQSPVASLCSRLQDAKADTVTAQPEVTGAALGCREGSSSQAPELGSVPENLENLALWRPEGEEIQEGEERKEATL